MNKKISMLFVLGSLLISNVHGMDHMDGRDSPSFRRIVMISTQHEITAMTAQFTLVPTDRPQSAKPIPSLSSLYTTDAEDARTTPVERRLSSQSLPA